MDFKHAYERVMCYIDQDFECMNQLYEEYTGVMKEQQRLPPYESEEYDNFEETSQSINE